MRDVTSMQFILIAVVSTLRLFVKEKNASTRRIKSLFTDAFILLITHKAVFVAIEFYFYHK